MANRHSDRSTLKAQEHFDVLIQRIRNKVPAGKPRLERNRAAIDPLRRAVSVAEPEVRDDHLFRAARLCAGDEDMPDAARSQVGGHQHRAAADRRTEQTPKRLVEKVRRSPAEYRLLQRSADRREHRRRQPLTSTSKATGSRWALRPQRRRSPRFARCSVRESFPRQSRRSSLKCGRRACPARRPADRRCTSG